MNLENKRAQICKIDFIPVNNAIVNNLPGVNYIRIRGEWTLIPISSGEFKEKSTIGDVVEQELNAVVTDTGANNLITLRGLLQHSGLIRYQSTNGEIKVIGTDQFPVRVTLENNGSPAKLTLSFKRDSPEPAKLFRSF